MNNNININDSDFLVFFLMSFMVIFGILLVIAIASYVICGWSYHQVAKDNDMPVWMAWTPFANIYFLFKVTKGNMWILLTLIYLIINIIGLYVEIPILLSLISIILALVFTIYQIILVYRLGKRYSASSVLFWIGIFIFPCLFAYYIQIGREAKKSYNSRLENNF